MGTRSEIVIWDNHTAITLYKHWDGYPDYMVPFLKDAALFAAYMAGSQRHWLTYAEDVASYIIFYHGLVSIYQSRKSRISVGINTDVRPAGDIADLTEYVYILRVNPNTQSPENDTLYWLLEVFSVENKDAFWDMDREKRDKAYLEYLKNGTEIPHLLLRDQIKIEIPVKGLREKIPLIVSVRRNNKNK
ncbi:MAG: hypothetical protein JHC26_01890 [Thermofilum sp.]|jgi:hypothetical protein|uniref:hypothetical protein n=1 Tax=Thermofilum sp. TaxID=1961369 RepID=UPI00258E153D|nr:hypothetical protein [Thermofilum sp.]MCI4407814.1 hypothetical protein [Thermofilum sp.]